MKSVFYTEFMSMKTKKIRTSLMFLHIRQKSSEPIYSIIILAEDMSSEPKTVVRRKTFMNGLAPISEENCKKKSGCQIK